MKFYTREEIRARMKKRRYTVPVLAKEIGISNNSLYSIVTGRTAMRGMRLGTYMDIVNKLWGDED